MEDFWVRFLLVLAIALIATALIIWAGGGAR